MPPPSDPALVREARRLRHQHPRMTFRAIAERIGASPKAVGEWCRGNTNANVVVCPDCGEPMLLEAPSCGFCVEERALLVPA